MLLASDVQQRRERSVRAARRRRWGQLRRVQRFLRSIRRECLDHLLIVNEAHLRHVLTTYVAYYNEARPQQGLDQRTPVPPAIGSGYGPTGGETGWAGCSASTIGRRRNAGTPPNEVLERCPRGFMCSSLLRPMG